MDNKFKCSHVRLGYCKRYLKACDEACRYFNQCGECRAYFIPHSQKPCRVCINNPIREKGGADR